MLDHQCRDSHLNIDSGFMPLAHLNIFKGATSGNVYVTSFYNRNEKDDNPLIMEHRLSKNDAFKLATGILACLLETIDDHNLATIGIAINDIQEDFKHPF